MSTRRHSKFSIRRASNSTRRPVAGGFTLIELLVVVAIIAVLMSILLPSLQAAREQARAVVCGQKLRDLATGMHTYFTEHQDWIPACNTSGVAVRARVGIPGAFYNDNMPVQMYDWMTPCLSPSTEMRPSRAQRFKELITEFACPSQSFYTAIFYPQGLSACQDRQEFEADPDGWTALSYLMPAHFQYWGQQYADQALTHHEANPNWRIEVMTADDDWEVVNQSYRSNLTQVGTPSQKIAAAEGTRYVTSDGTVDFDPSPDPTLYGSGVFGSFTSSGAWWSGSTAYGVRAGTQNWSGTSIGVGSDSQGKNLELSYRHGTTRGPGPSGAARDNRAAINAMFFDGSVRRLNDQESRNPVYWYPRGSEVQGSANELMVNDLGVGDLIP